MMGFFFSLRRYVFLFDFYNYFFFGIVGGNVFVDIEQEKSWVAEGHSEVEAYKFCPNC